MTATFSHCASGERTGFSPVLVQPLPSALRACPIHECSRACPVYHISYPSPRLITTGRLMSSSQSVAEFGPRTIAGSLQCTPSVLSTSASDFFGRHENHMRYVFPSLSTVTSKQV